MVHSMSQQNLDYGIQQARRASKIVPVEKVCYQLNLSEQSLKDILMDFLLRSNGITLEGALSAGATFSCQSGSSGSEYSAKVYVEKPGPLPDQPEEHVFGDSEPLWQALKALSASPNQEGAFAAMKILGSTLLDRGYQAHVDSLEFAVSLAEDTPQ